MGAIVVRVMGRRVSIGLSLTLVFFLLGGCSLREPLARDAPSPNLSTPSRVDASTPSLAASATGLPTTTETPLGLAFPAVVATTAPRRSRPSKTPTPTLRQSLEQSPMVPLVPASRFPRTLPGPTKVSSGDEGTELALLTQHARTSGMATEWRKVAELALQRQRFTAAADALGREAAIYRSKGLLQAALAEEARAAQVSTDLALYATTPSMDSPKERLQRLEPESGCYVGAFIDRDDNLKRLLFDSQTHGDVDQFQELVHKPHASYFMYRTYGQPFPLKWARYLKQRGAFPHIAWEPKNLDDVRDDAYLEKFVDDMVALDYPVMLRFASEMNGEWTPYHSDPEAYKEAFQLVYRATRRAPKVAMMWCPNTVPRQGIEEYYPGDEAVDWVGVNFYSVPFLDNDRSRSGDNIHPTDLLTGVYDRYAARKPIAVGEWAASRQSSLSDEPTTDFAKTKMSQLYAALPTRFPRVKMVNWYDSNNLKEARPGRQLNNYQLTSPPDLLSHYREAIGSSYYLGGPGSTPVRSYTAVNGRISLTSSDEIRLFLKTYDQHPKVYFRLNGEIVLATDEPLHWRLPTATWKAGKNVLDVFVYDSKDRFVSKVRNVFDVSL